MEPSVSHLSPEVLRALGAGLYDAHSIAQALAHIDTCPGCKQAVLTTLGAETLRRLRTSQSSPGITPTALGHGETASPQLSLADTLNTKQATPTVLPELANHPQYEVVRELGRGGMGVVYLANNRLMDRLEVLKVVNQRLLSHPTAAERFLREIRSAAKLNHPNVVTAYSALQVGELLVFAMEYVEGQNLAQFVQEHGPLPVTNACYYVQQAAQGLQHAHDRGMVHRDIKPHNLILSRGGKKHVVKVLDFGLAKATRENEESDRALTGTGAMLGTPDYIAPEQINDATRADIRADIYSLGCTLYFLLTGRAPFQGGSHFEVLMAHSARTAEPLNEARKDVPAALAAVAAKMMSKDPAQRYQTPAEVVQALAPFLKPGAKPAPAPQPATSLPATKPPTPAIFEMNTVVPGRDSPPADPKPARKPADGIAARPTQRPTRGPKGRDAEPARTSSTGLLVALGAGGALVVLLGGCLLFAVVAANRRDPGPDGEYAENDRDQVRVVATEPIKTPVVTEPKPRARDTTSKDTTAKPRPPDPPKKLSEANYSKLQIGMSLKDVEAILGKGFAASDSVFRSVFSRSSFQEARERSWRLAQKKGRVYYWAEDTTRILVCFTADPQTKGKVDAHCRSVDGYASDDTGSPLKVITANFDKLKAGMTLKQVEEILGEGKVAAPSNIRAAFSYSRFDQTKQTAFSRAAQQERVYLWEEETARILVCFPTTPVSESKAEIIWFTPGTYSEKKQKPEDKWAMTQDNFGKLTVGMTLAQVEDILGGGNEAAAPEVDTSFPVDPKFQAVKARWSKAARAGRVWIWRSDTYIIMVGFPGNPQKDKVEALYEGYGLSGPRRERGSLSGLDE